MSLNRGTGDLQSARPRFRVVDLTWLDAMQVVRYLAAQGQTIEEREDTPPEGELNPFQKMKLSGTPDDTETVPPLWRTFWSAGT